MAVVHSKEGLYQLCDQQWLYQCPIIVGDKG